MREPERLGERQTGPGIGRAEKLEDARGRYVAFVKNTFPRDLSLDGVRVVVDAAHGAAYVVAPLVFSELGAQRPRHRGEAERHQHQPRGGGARTPSTPAPRWCAAAPTSGSPSTATPTA